MGEPSKFLIDEWNDSIERVLIALAPIEKQAGDFLWRGIGGFLCRSNRSYSTRSLRIIASTFLSKFDQPKYFVTFMMGFPTSFRRTI